MPKVCSKCHLEKDESCFYQDKDHLDGLSSYCKPCRRASTAEYKSRKDAKREYLFLGFGNTKVCPSCNKAKRPGEFPKEKKKTSGYGSYCKKCKARKCRKWHSSNADRVRDRQMRVRFHLSLEAYEALLEKAGYRCQICGTPAKEMTRRLHIDHDHATGQIRGLLCNNCNRGIGHLKDSVEILVSAAAYLRESKNAKV